MTPGDAIQLIGAVAFIGLGLFMLAAPERFRRSHMRNKQREIADRMARGEDAYFEELRTLQAYRRPPSGVRFLGGLLALLGVATIALFLTGAGR